ncbi:unnamed protein product [Schistosoma rodhaini]|uniref:MADF domain-containing protein n=1 Tax=Schistosoma rodhaini TaxID=6188 RepID=A0AA85G857_9TREM|nr:unnamed protein product [Schistosoma rodhaini]CAH8608951.1 unnamed protein product [Schistosoma rodhaini]
MQFVIFLFGLLFHVLKLNLQYTRGHSCQYCPDETTHKYCSIMINTPRKSACASKLPPPTSQTPTPPPPTTTQSNMTMVTRYTTEEANELAKLVLRYRDIWKDKKQSSALVQKHLWMQFSQYLHSKGWPRRNWTQLRRKGQSLLRKFNDMTTNQLEVSKSNPNPLENPSNHTPLSSSNANPHVNGHIGSVTENQSSVHRPNLPTLTPSPVVSTTSKRATPSLSSPTNHVQPNPPNTSGPKILNAFSTAHMSQQLAIPHDVAVLQPTTTNNNNMVGEVAINRVALLTPLSCISFGVARAHTASESPVREVNMSKPPSDQPSRNPVTATIDLSVSSDDEESCQELSGTRDQVNTNHVNDLGETSEDSVTSECEGTPLSETLIHKRIKCLDLKIEILQMKKQYWSEKLKLSSKS